MNTPATWKQFFEAVGAAERGDTEWFKSALEAEARETEEAIRFVRERIAAIRGTAQDNTQRKYVCKCLHCKETFLANYPEAKLCPSCYA
jgi:transcription initiation factor IIE alpha subunit